jgi:hypothetical protein
MRDKTQPYTILHLILGFMFTTLEFWLYKQSHDNAQYEWANVTVDCELLQQYIMQSVELACMWIVKKPIAETIYV